MVTFQLQNMRGTVPGWEEWYAVKQEEMKRDPLMKYFGELRTQIEKQAAQPAQMLAYVKSIGPKDWSIFEPRPPGAIELVIGSAPHGGASGWLVDIGDGKQELYAVEIPSRMVEIVMTLGDVPPEYSGASAVDLIATYLNKIEVLVDEVDAEFCS